MKSMGQVRKENYEAIIKNSYYKKQDFTDGTSAYKMNEDSDYLFLDELMHTKLTLDKVLIAVEPYISDETIYFSSQTVLRLWYVKWDLTKYELDQQTEKTQRLINKLLT
jgi:hypothetical protein|tara:strand:- start:29 stop:355 length:327 start_codon:yes stop_codon:yes gene_type:complete